MNIETYRKMKGISQSVFADMLTDVGSPATQGLISQWESGEVRIPAERCVVIASVTGGVVSPCDLRPDIFAPVLQAETGDTKEQATACLTQAGMHMAAGDA